MSKVNQKLFFDSYPYPLTTAKKNNLIYTIDKFDESILLTRLSWLAYIIATMRKETNDTFAPVVEGYYIPASKRAGALYNYYAKNNPGALRTIFPNGRYGINFTGRGDVQITHNYNYDKFRQLVLDKYPNKDIVANPEFACEPDIAFLIMEEGMTRSDLTFRDENFTGFTLEQFLNDKKLDWTGARKIINGKDCANEIAKYAIAYYDILEFEDEEKPEVKEIILPDEELVQAEALDAITIEVDGIPYKADILLS